MAAILAATRPGSPLNVIAVFVTGRAASLDPNASIETLPDIGSVPFHVLNTRRMAGFLQHAGRSVPIYMGESVYRTRLRTVIPHGVHVDEHDYDIFGDRETGRVAGEFLEGLEFLRAYEGEELLVLAGGPLTELALILRHYPDIAAKFSTMVVQAGDFGEGNSSNLLGGQGNSFNGACDPVALYDVMNGYHEDVFILPSNITKDPAIGFKNPGQIATLGIYRELLTLYIVHHRYTAAKRGTPLFIHDLGLVMLLEQIIRGDHEYPYQYEPVKILSVPFDTPAPGEPDMRGTIIVEPTTRSKRYRVIGQDTSQYRDRVATYLQG
jgi:inosine-uridine nucleoside N-ribohydrolase